MDHHIGDTTITWGGILENAKHHPESSLDGGTGFQELVNSHMFIQKHMGMSWGTLGISCGYDGMVIWGHRKNGPGGITEKTGESPCGMSYRWRSRHAKSW